MRKLLFIALILLVVPLSGCIKTIEDMIDQAYQDIEVDHFELVSEDKIEFLMNSDEEIDFKDYVNRVTPEGTILSKDKFDVNSEDFDISKVGEYEIIYEFFSLDTPYEFTVTVYVVEKLSQ